MSKKFLLILLMLTVGLLINIQPFLVQAQLSTIDFETIPDVGTPTEGLIISDQFKDTHGVTFSLEGGGYPCIAEVGSPTTAFTGPPNNTGSDQPDDDQNIGDYFLTDDGELSSSLISPALIVNYDPPTSEASGVILDIDFDETFLIEAMDSSGNIIDTISITAGDANTGDGIASFWSFEHSNSDIYSIRFKGTRTESGGFGLGFDNFNARSIFAGELPENINTYLILTEDSVPFNLPAGSYVQGYGSNGINTLNVEKYARLQCRNFIGENEINIEETSSQFTVYRSGATVYLNSTSGTRVEIAATETSQTLRFADGSLELTIIDGNVMLGSQTIDETEQSIDSDVDNSDTSESIF